MHTLDESLEQMMSGSFEVSFLSGANGGQQHFSDAGFDFGDSDNFGFVDISEELAKELGEGWASAPVQPKLVSSFLTPGQCSHCQTRSSVETGQQLPTAEMNIDFDRDNDFAFTGLSQHSLARDSPALCTAPVSQQSSAKKRVSHIRGDAICNDLQPRRTSM